MLLSWHVVEFPSLEMFKNFWRTFWPTSSRRSCLSRGLGPDNLWRSLPTSTRLCFCDSVEGMRHLKSFRISKVRRGCICVCLIFTSSWLFNLLQAWGCQLHKKRSGVIQRHNFPLREVLITEQNANLEAIHKVLDCKIL